ncbi:aspartate/glutamate racemase family protein [Castellaniella sp. FW104-16D08]|uniref:aspartate/glutamate racemase family protein n=1 Tax=unclassified Castellaniella TaxID=2617606 RepID=UPI003316280F
MKILLLNPNISNSVTQLIQHEAQRAALPDTEITAETVDMGVAYIETPAESVVAAYASFVHLAQCHTAYDGVVIAAYGDPGVAQAKELFPIPVVGLTESALASAFLLGGRFGIVGISKRIGYWYQQTLEALGMSHRFIGYQGLGRAFSDVGAVQDEARAALLRMCLQQVDAGADTIILAGAPLAGLARQIESQVPVPLVDGVGSAVRMVETLVRSNYQPRRAGPLAPPPAKPNQQMNPALAALFAGQSDAIAGGARS